MRREAWPANITPVIFTGQSIRQVKMSKPTTLCRAFQRTAAIAPEAIAVRTVGGTRELTWRDYAEQVRMVAAGLDSLGITPGDTVALMMANRIEFYPIDVGAQH